MLAQKPPIKTDICVIGAGSAGLSVAAAAAAFGVPVVLIERGAMGGDCLNAGCVPSKALIAAGMSAQIQRNAGRFGLAASEPHANFARVSAHVADVIGSIAPNDSVARFTALGVHVIQGEARFLDARTVLVDGQPVRARRFVIATGARAALPAVPGLADIAYETNETLFALTRRPERLLILGGGPVGIEMAQAMRRLGAAVTVLESQRILPRDDAEAADVIRRSLLLEGVTLIEKAKILRAEMRGARINLILDEDGQERPVEGSHLLVAAGRCPNIETLQLDKAGIKAGSAGILVDRGLRTSNRRVFAIGDCCHLEGEPQHRFTHVANYHAGLVIRSALFRLPVRTSMAAIPRVTYCEPEIASVGLSEEDAARRKLDFRVLRWPFSENDRARAERRIEGLVKLVATPKGRILGITIAGAHAGELIVPWCMAIQKNYAIKDMANLVFPYPTFAEATKRAAMSFYAPLASRPGLRRLISFLRKFG